MKDLRSCCWHKKSPLLEKPFIKSGDYILVNKNCQINKLEIPSIFYKKGENNRLFSDHAPVFANISL